MSYQTKCQNCGRRYVIGNRETHRKFCSRCEKPEVVERRRGHNDALAGHGPAMFDGPYMIGYRRGKAEMGQPMSYLPPTEI